MSHGLMVSAAFAMALACAASTAQSEPAPKDDLARLMFFVGTDLWRDGGFTYGGAVWSPKGVDREGFALKTFLGTGHYQYISGALGDADVTGRQFTAFVMPGWRFIRDKLIVTVFGGIDVQNHTLRPNDPSAGLRGTQFGLRTGVEVWYEPTAQMMLAADGSVSTVARTYSARIAAGWRFFDRVYLGPEAQAFSAQQNYQQMRVGLHATGFKTGALEWSSAVGWSVDSDRRQGAYGKIGLVARH